MPAKDILFSAKGRIGRKDFWIASLLLAFAAVPPRFLGPLGDVIALVLVFPQVCLLAKRRHDCGKSGWWAAAVYVPPGLVGLLLGFSTSETGEPPVAVSIFMTVAMVASVGLYFRFGLAKGDLEPNAYGPPPSGRRPIGSPASEAA